MRKHLTYADIVSTIALFIVLSGTGYALSKLPNNSVGSKQLRKNAVSTKKIKNSAVTGAKLAKGVVTDAKIASEAVTGDKVKESTLGTVPSATTVMIGSS